MLFTVADLTERDAIDTASSKVPSGAMVYIESLKRIDKWNGSAWEDATFLDITFEDGAVLKSLDGNIQIEITSVGDDKGWKLVGGTIRSS